MWHIWGLCCQKHVSQAGISNYIPQSTVGCNYFSLFEIPASGNILLWDVITYPCLRYLLLATKSTYVLRNWVTIGLDIRFAAFSSPSLYINQWWPFTNHIPRNRLQWQTRQHSTQSVGNMPPPSPRHLLPHLLQIMPRNPKYDQFQPKGHHNEENPQSMTKMPGNPKFYQNAWKPQILPISLSQNSIKIRKIYKL